MYKAVKAFGHNVYIVAATSNQSGMGGRAVFTDQANLTADTEFGESVKQSKVYLRVTTE